MTLKDWIIYYYPDVRKDGEGRSMVSAFTLTTFLDQKEILALLPTGPGRRDARDTWYPRTCEHPPSVLLHDLPRVATSFLAKHSVPS